MSTPSQPPPLPSRSEVEGDVLALIAAAFNDDQEGRQAIFRNIEENVRRGVPWQFYVATMPATAAAYLVLVLKANGANPAEWVAERQAELRARIAGGTADG